MHPNVHCSTVYNSLKKEHSGREGHFFWEHPCLPTPTIKKRVTVKLQNPNKAACQKGRPFGCSCCMEEYSILGKPGRPWSQRSELGRHASRLQPCTDGKISVATQTSAAGTVRAPLPQTGPQAFAGCPQWAWRSWTDTPASTSVNSCGS